MFFSDRVAIVPIIGSARHGKDTFAEVVLESTAHNYYRLALADAVKLECMDMYGDEFPEFNVEFDAKGRISYPNDTTDPGRRIMRRMIWQRWGTEARRNLFPDIWIWKWAARAMQLIAHGFTGLTIPDVRFENEASYFAQIGRLCAVVRTNPDGSLYQAPGVDLTHASEVDVQTVIQKYAFLRLFNSSDIDTYKREVARYLRSYDL